MALNLHRVNDWHEAMKLATNARERGWVKVAARWLETAGEIRRNAWKPWDYEFAAWVCQCCLLVAANGECCADDEHGGDSMEPLGLAKDSDTWHLGGEHSDDCDAGNDSGCDCETDTFSTSQCDGCGSWLAGERHAMTVFVNGWTAPISV